MGTGNATVTIKLDEERPLRFDFQALCRLEDFGVELSALKELGESGRAPVRLLAQMLAAGLTTREYKPSPDEIITLIDEMPGTLGEKMTSIAAAIGKAFTLGMPEAAEGNVGGSGSGSTGVRSESSALASSVSPAPISLT